MDRYGLGNRFVFTPCNPTYDLDYNQPNQELVFIPLEGAVQLHGQWVPCLFQRSKNGSPFLVIHIHGQSGDIGRSAHLWFGVEALDVNVLSIEWPGYGVFVGSPSQSLIISIVDGVLQYLETKLSIPLERIILCGRSLGSGVVLGTLQQRWKSSNASSPPRLAGLILISAFQSLNDVISGFPGGRMLTTLLLSERFNNLAAMQNMHSPLLLIHGERDRLIPYQHSQALLEAAATPLEEKSLALDPKGTHPRVHATQSLQNFIRKLSSAASSNSVLRLEFPTECMDRNAAKERQGRAKTQRFRSSLWPCAVSGIAVSLGLYHFQTNSGKWVALYLGVLTLIVVGPFRHPCRIFGLPSAITGAGSYVFFFLFGLMLWPGIGYRQGWIGIAEAAAAIVVSWIALK